MAHGALPCCSCRAALCTRLWGLRHGVIKDPLPRQLALQPHPANCVSSPACPPPPLSRKYLEERSREARAELEEFDKRRRERQAEQQRLWREQEREKEKER